MKKDRLVAFTDAVLIIIMTILVLELEKPSTINLRTFWELRRSFFVYLVLKLVASLLKNVSELKVVVLSCIIMKLIEYIEHIKPIKK